MLIFLPKSINYNNYYVTYLLRTKISVSFEEKQKFMLMFLPGYVLIFKAIKISADSTF